MAPLLVIKCENHISDHDHGNFADDIVIIVINGKMIATILMTIIMILQHNHHHHHHHHHHQSSNMGEKPRHPEPTVASLIRVILISTIVCHQHESMAIMIIIIFIIEIP